MSKRPPDSAGLLRARSFLHKHYLRTPLCVATAWCGSVHGAGAPIVTTSDEQGADLIVWMLGSEGDERLHAFRGDTGAPLVSTRERMQGLRHFGTILAANARLYVAAEARIYAFAF